MIHTGPSISIRNCLPEDRREKKLCVKKRMRKFLFFSRVEGKVYPRAHSVCKCPIHNTCTKHLERLGYIALEDKVDSKYTSRLHSIRNTGPLQSLSYYSSVLLFTLSILYCEENHASLISQFFAP